MDDSKSKKSSQNDEFENLVSGRALIARLESKHSDKDVESREESSKDQLGDETDSRRKRVAGYQADYVTNVFGLKFFQHTVIACIVGLTYVDNLYDTVISHDIFVLMFALVSYLGSFNLMLMLHENVQAQELNYFILIQYTLACGALFGALRVITDLIIFLIYPAAIYIICLCIILTIKLNIYTFTKPEKKDDSTSAEVSGPRPKKWTFLWASLAALGIIDLLLVHFFPNLTNWEVDRSSGDEWDEPVNEGQSTWTAPGLSFFIQANVAAVIALLELDIHLDIVIDVSHEEAYTAHWIDYMVSVTEFYYIQGILIKQSIWWPFNWCAGWRFSRSGPSLSAPSK